METQLLPTVEVLSGALERSLVETLSVMFFAEVNEVKPVGFPHDGEDDGQAGDREAPYRVVVGFDGAHRGRLAMQIEAQFAAFCDESFEARDMDEDGNGEGASPADSVREMGNIICGSLLSNLWPDGLFHVHEPQLVAEITPSGSALRTALCLSTYDGNLCAEFSLEQGGESGKGQETHG